MLNPLLVRKELQSVGKYMMENQLAWGNAGNISARSGSEEFMITASGTYLGELENNDLVECPLFGGVTVLEKKKPSKEIPMHRAIYQSRPDIQAVLHASPFYSTLVACSSLNVAKDWFVETMYYLERVERVPYHHPGSEELGQAVREKAKLANILILENHGVLVYDVSIREARMALHTLELACKMMLLSKRAGTDMNALSQDVMSDFLNNAGYKPRRNWNV
ncbi:MAG: fuculose phosphate aldolase [Bacilli bacterium]|jgi:ribulose-5-phosphate 4-epimerase/fuculose-1-phosphate aldolase|nr:fuculose phosphate aldolase [Bacilli bacterium]